MVVGGGKQGPGETKTRSTYLTRFCVHSRSRLVSRATLMPSEKFERAPFRRRWARACSSMSSRCLAFKWPELLRSDFLVTCSRGSQGNSISRDHEHIKEREKTHVCACMAIPLSNGVGSKVSCMRSFRTSTTSTPEYEPELDS